jgi:hypothetical protein
MASGVEPPCVSMAENKGWLPMSPLPRLALNYDSTRPFVFGPKAITIRATATNIPAM